MTADGFILLTDDGPVRTLTLNSPDRKNAVPRDQWDGLAAAFSEFEQSARLSDDAPLHLAALGTAYARAGQTERARGTLLQLQRLASSRFVPALYFAGLHLSLGEREQALAALEKAHQERSDYFLYLSVDPIFRELRDEPRFANLVKKLGLPLSTR